jgi:hypothetical protein
MMPAVGLVARVRMARKAATNYARFGGDFTLDVQFLRPERLRSLPVECGLVDALNRDLS